MGGSTMPVPMTPFAFFTFSFFSSSGVSSRRKHSSLMNFVSATHSSGAQRVGVFGRKTGTTGSSEPWWDVLERCLLGDGGGAGSIEGGQR